MITVTPTVARRTITRDHVLWGLALVVALGLRLMYMRLEWGQDLWNDEGEYLDLAHALRQGGYIDDWKFLRPPLYPLFIAALLPSSGTLLFVKLVQVGLSVATVGLLARIAQQLWQNRRIAILTAWLGALWIPAITHSAFLLTETLFLFLGALLMLTLFAHFAAPRSWRVVIAGLLLAALMLTRPIALLLLPFVAGFVMLPALQRFVNIRHTRGPHPNPSPVATGEGLSASLNPLLPQRGYPLGGVGRRSDRGGGLRLVPWLQNSVTHPLVWAALFLAVALGGIAPWTARNFQVHQRLIPLDTTGGFNAWWGNLPPGGDDEFKVAYDQIPNLADRQAQAYRRAIANIRSNPSAAVWQDVHKGYRLLRSETDSYLSGVPVELSTKTTGTALLVLTDLQYLVFGLAIIVGLAWSRVDRKQAVILIWCLIMVFGPVLTLVMPRFRIPALFFLLPYAARALVLFAQRPAISKWRTAVALVVATGFLLATQIPQIVVSQPILLTAQRLERAGATEQASVRYRQAMQSYGHRIDGYVAWGELLRRQGDLAGALAVYGDAVARLPAHRWSRMARLDILRAQGDLAGAQRELQKSQTPGTETQTGEQVLNTWLWQHYEPLPLSRIDVGVSDLQELGYTEGLQGAEQAGELTYRWSDAQWRVRLPFASATPPSIVALTVASGRPDGIASPQASVWLNGQAVQALPPLAAGFQFQTIQIPAPPELASPLLLEIRTDTWVPGDILPDNDDPRVLGLVVDRIELLYEH